MSVTSSLLGFGITHDFALLPTEQQPYADCLWSRFIGLFTLAFLLSETELPIHSWVCLHIKLFKFSGVSKGHWVVGESFLSGTEEEAGDIWIIPLS